MPYDWQPVNDSLKRRIVDSVKTAQTRTARIAYTTALIRWVNQYGKGYPQGLTAPEGEPLVYPAKTFNQGQTIPAKLRILCGGVNLRSGEIEEPEIVGIVPLGGSALALDRVAFNADGPDPFDPNFTFNATFQQWNFNIRTDELAPGTYVLKIRIGGSMVYDAAFVLR